MNYDSIRNSFYHLFIVVTATIAGTFHSPVPSSNPAQQEYVMEESTTNLSEQKTLPVQSEPVSNILGSEKAYVEVTPSIAPSVIPTKTFTKKPTPVFISTFSPSVTPIPTLRPSSTPTRTPTIVVSQYFDKVEPTPTETKQEVVLNIPANEPMMTKWSLNPDKILDLINEHREELQLPLLVEDEQLCKLAEYRTPQLYKEIFETGDVHKGLYDLNLPYYITENMAHYGSEHAIINWWLSSFIHRAAIEGNYKYSCGACEGNSCSQLFTNYTSKAQ